MGDKNESKIGNQTAHEAVREAVERSDSIRDEVRNITLKALSQGQLDVEKIRQVTHEVMEGASLGAGARGAHIKECLSEAMSGMDDALATSAEASKLALEEAAGQLEHFGKQDLKQALDELLLLEDMFLETVKRVATASNGAVKSTLNDLVQHARNSGTSVGSRSADIVETLNQSVGRTVHDSITVGSDTALKVGHNLSQAAAGFLEGFVETLETKVAGCHGEKKASQPVCSGRP